MENDTVPAPTPVVTAAPEMPVKKSNLPLIIGIIVALLMILVVVGYFVWQAYYPAPQPTLPTVTTTITPTPVPTPVYENPFDYQNPFTE